MACCSLIRAVQMITLLNVAATVKVQTDIETSVISDSLPETKVGNTAGDECTKTTSNRLGG